MLVRHWMSKKVITVNVQASMREAVELMRTHHVHSLPVMKDDRIVGIISDRDLKKASPSEATALEIHELLYIISRIKIEDIMVRKVITIPDTYTIEETAQLLVQNNISGAPVLDDSGKLVGIITKNDIFKALMSLTGMGKECVLFAFRTLDTPGSIKELTDIVRQFGGRLRSIWTSYHNVPENHRNVYIRACYLDHDELPELVEQLKEKGRLLYLVDHYTGTRQIVED